MSRYRGEEEDNRHGEHGKVGIEIRPAEGRTTEFRPKWEDQGTIPNHTCNGIVSFKSQSKARQLISAVKGNEIISYTGRKETKDPRGDRKRRD